VVYNRFLTSFSLDPVSFIVNSGDASMTGSAGAAQRKQTTGSTKAT